MGGSTIYRGIIPIQGEISVGKTTIPEYKIRGDTKRIITERVDYQMGHTDPRLL